MPIMLDKLHHVSRQTRNVDVTRSFYVEVLGFQEISRPLFPFKGAWLFGAGIQMHLIEEPFAPPPEQINSRENHIAFAVEDVEGAAEWLEHHQVAYQRRIVPERGVNQIFFRDPDGWLIELAKYPAGMNR
jgi:catechol 2,3-dioxygenase-like lactoylglutathione lyase family enzyme